MAMQCPDAHSPVTALADGHQGMDRNGPARDPARVTRSVDRSGHRRASARRSPTLAYPHPGHTLALNPAPAPGRMSQLNSVDDRRSPSSSLRSSSLSRSGADLLQTGADSACPAPAGTSAGRSSADTTPNPPANTSFHIDHGAALVSGPPGRVDLAFGHRIRFPGAGHRGESSNMDQRSRIGTSRLLVRFDDHGRY
jgi:hypothetical protein